LQDFHQPQGFLTEEIANKARSKPRPNAGFPIQSGPSSFGIGAAPIEWMARDHRKLDAFKLADQLALAVYVATADFPPNERYGLQSQLRRAAVSTPTNIVEGCARDSEADYLRFLDIALGSAREALYLMSLAKRLSMFERTDAGRIESLGERVAGAIVNLRRSLRP
jgi:four helix bundle protein